MARRLSRPRISKQLRRARGRLGGATSQLSQHPDDELLQIRHREALKDFHALALEDHILHVFELVTLDDEQRQHLADLFRRPGRQS